MIRLPWNTLWAQTGLKAKLLTLIAAAVFAFLCLAVYAISDIGALKSQVDILGLERIPLTGTLGEVLASNQAVPRYMWLALAYPPGSVDRKKHLENAENSINLLRASLEKYGSYHIAEAARPKLAGLRELVPALAEVVEKAKAGLSAGTEERDAWSKRLLMEEMPPVALKITALATEISEIALKANQADVEASEALAARAKAVLVLVSLLLGAGLFAFGLILSNRLSGDLLKITEAVGEASSQVSSASEQLSHAAEQLSAASQEQAAAIEETSAALTEIAGTVESNAKRAEGANESAKSVHQLSEGTRKSMEELGAAMEAILESNSKIERVAKLVEEISEKTELIDEIVFKTQLLSFNASVEAERAGEHGRGFAVVAQEVGNLSQLSGKAAAEISKIVKASVKEAEAVAADNKSRVQAGGALAARTRESMSLVLAELERILEGTGRIADASREQSRGVKEISTSVDGVSQATQETAATSEESASASEELASQAESLMGMVEKLRAIVTGSEGAPSARAASPAEGGGGRVIRIRSKDAGSAAATASPGGLGKSW